MPLDPASRRTRPTRALRATLTSGALLAGAGLVLVTATPVFAAAPVHAATPAAQHPIVIQAPGDQVSVSVPGVGPDFGSIKQGTVVTRTIEILNDGVDSISIDPATFTALTAPFSLKSTTLVAGAAIAPGQRRSVTVSYTAPAAGDHASQLINLQLVDLDRPGTGSYGLRFTANSLATDRAHFEATTGAGAKTVDFGSVKVGASGVVALKLVVQGIDSLLFREGAIGVLDQNGKPLAVTVSKSSFGSGKTYDPGATATFELTFAPEAAGAIAGTVTITAQVMNGGAEAPTVQERLPVSGSAPEVVTPTSTPTPTPAPTSGPSTPTPGTGSPGGSAGAGTSGAAGGPASGVGVGSGSGSSRSNGSSLAQTGAAPAIGLGFAGLTLAIGGSALALVKRSRRRVQRKL